MASGDAHREPWALAGRSLWLGTLAVLLLAALFFLSLYAPSPLIYDADSYYHLAVARDYAEGGIGRELESIRFGLLADQFGDKELLFHVLLMPFVSWLEPTVGGRVALGLLGAAILAVIGFLSLRAIGWWGLVVPFWLVLGSMEFVWRLVRLRAELMSCLLLLLALWAAVRNRYLLLGLLSALFALGYTAIHAFVGLFGLLFLARGWASRRWDWRLLVSPLVGSGIGLLVHPQFPDNLAVWWFQSVEYFRFKGVLDVGTEIEPMRTDLLLLVNLAWFLGLWIWWRASARRGSEPPGSPPALLTEASLVFGVASVVFGVLYLLMSRFAIYFVPLVSLWVLFAIRRHGGQLSRRVRLPFRGELALGWAWVVCFLVGLPVAVYELDRYRVRNSPGPADVRLTDREELAEVLPVGARVAATWRSTPIYMFWAPQARFLNVLDPVFLAAQNPAVHAAQQAVFDGTESDVPLVTAAVLDSEYLVYSQVTESRTLTQRLLNDPRAQLLHQSVSLVFRLREAEGGPFLLDWRVAPPGSVLPAAPDQDLADWPEYPRLPDPRLRRLEGFVDARRVAGPDSCLGLVHFRQTDRDREVVLELAGVGPSTAWLDGRELVRIQDVQQAVLGRGSLLRLSLSAGEHRITVLTCPDPGSGRSGFYLVERE